MSRADRSASRRRLDRLALRSAGVDLRPAAPPRPARPSAAAVPDRLGAAGRAGRPSWPDLKDTDVTEPAGASSPAVDVASPCTEVGSAGVTDAAVPALAAALPSGGGWVPDAMRSAAADYRYSYGTATDLSGDDEPPIRVRWSVPWRLAASVATAIALVVGATLIRASALAPGDPVDLPVPASASAAGGTAAAEPSANPSVPAEGASTLAPPLVVHVVGAVVAPGVVHLPTGARVQDAIAACGGALPEANLEALNLARVLTDGEQVLVPRPGEVAEPTGSAGAGPGATRVDLNSAALADLDALPGIGPVLAQRILDRRLQHRFTSVDELGEVSGIGPTLLERLRALVRV